MEKCDRIILRIAPEQRKQFEGAAERDGKSVSEWLRNLGARAVRAAARKAAKS